MQDQIEKLFYRIHNLTEMGALDEALKMLLMMKQKLPMIQNEVEIEILKVKLMQRSYEEVLDEALVYMQNGNNDLLYWLLKEYNEPFYQQHQKLKEINVKKINEYNYFYGTIDESDIKILWYGESGRVVFVRENHIIQLNDNIEFENYDNVTILCNVIQTDKILEYEKITEYKGELPYYNEPLYLYYDNKIFDVLLQCVDFTPLLKHHRIVIIVGERYLIRFFEDLQIEMPTFIFGYGRKMVAEVLDRVYLAKYNTYLNDLRQAKQFYHESGDRIVERIKDGKLKILFSVSFFTTILKHHIRDCIRAVEKMGIKTELLIEKGDIFRITEFERVSVLNSFRPDVIFCVDHLRFEAKKFGYCPDEIVWICWVQDPLPAVMNKNTPAELGKRDFVLNHFISWKAFWEVGYPSEVLIDAPIPASANLYKIYELKKEDYDRFACDICFVCHASDVDAHIKKVITKLGLKGGQQEVCKCIYHEYQQYVYKTGKFFYSREYFEEFLLIFFTEYFGRKEDAYLTELQKALTDDMYLWYNQRVYRQTLVDWILDAGFTNIKLWGNGWKDNEKYQAYAMGPAENGEMLSKIYQASKIVVGNNIMTTAAARAWETMLSGGFYLSNYIPEEEDVADIRKIVEIGKDVIMFYGKDDLLDKIRFYLEHGEERQIMIERGRKVALEKMTFDILMKHTLSEIAKRLEE